MAASDKNSDPLRFITLKQAAELLHVEVRWIRHKIKNGSGPPTLNLGKPGRQPVLRLRYDTFMTWADSFQIPVRTAKQGTRACSVSA